FTRVIAALRFHGQAHYEMAPVTISILWSCFLNVPGIGVGGVAHATFLRVGCGVHKAAGWAANSPYSHTMSDLPADGSPPCQQSRSATRLCTCARTVRGVSALQALRR